MTQSMRCITTLALAAGMAASAGAADFFSTEKCDNWLTFGARIGVNTSNRTVSKDLITPYSRQSWGTGFNVGITADLNFRDYLSIQPGVFFESRSGDYTFQQELADGQKGVYSVMQAGHRRSYNLTVPVLASFRFNITDDVRWSVDFGPYVSFVLDSSHKNKALLSNGDQGMFTPPFMPETKDVDFGFKMGTGLTILSHYYVGVHYEAGVLDAYKDVKIDGYKLIYGGRTKAWLFTLGYNF